MGRRAAVRLTAAQVAALAQRYRAGTSLHVLAAETSVHATSLGRELQRRGVRLRGKGEAARLRARGDRLSDLQKAWTCKPGPLALVIGRSPDDPYRGAERLSARLRAMRAQARRGGALLVGPLTIAAAHAAGLTLDDIETVFAIPPAEAVAMIAAGHGGR